MPNRSSRRRGSFPERRRGARSRFLQSPRFPHAALALLLAVLLGAQLGGSAVSRIGPAPSPWRARDAGLSPARLPQPPPLYSPLYGWSRPGPPSTLPRAQAERTSLQIFSEPPAPVRNAQ